MGKFHKLMESLYDMTEFSWAADNASRAGTLAAYLDRLIRSRDTIEDIVKQATAEGQKRGHRTNYTEGYIHGHIKFRIQQAVTSRKEK